MPHAELIAADETGEVLGKPFYVMAEIDGWSPMDGGWRAAVRHRPRRPARPGVPADRGCGETRPGGLEGTGPGGVRQARRLPRTPGRPLAGLPAGRIRSANCPASTSPPTGCAQPARALHARDHARRLPVRQRDVRARRARPAGRDRGLGDDHHRRPAAGPRAGVCSATTASAPAATGFYLADGRACRLAAELLAHYEKVSGLSTENIHYYLVLANWKLGIVLEKTYAAAVHGRQGRLRR